MPSNEMEMFFRSVLPPGSLWRLFRDGDFQKLLDAMGKNSQVVYEYLFQLAHIRDPYKTPILSDLEREYGVLSDNNLTGEIRRKQLAAIQYAPKGSGSISLLQDKLTQAGFNLVVVNNNPVIDPAPFLLEDYLTYAGEALAQAGEPLALAGKFGGELIAANVDTIDPETKTIYEYDASDRSDLWRFIFFVAGSVANYTPLQDWNMERADTASWSLGAFTQVEKEFTEKESGLRGLKVSAARNTDEQNIVPLQPDASLDTSLLLIRDGIGNTLNQAYKNYLLDGDMEEADGPDIIVDGDMEAGPGSELMVDGDMEDVGVGAYSVGNSATLTKDVTSPHGGSQCLRVAYNAVNDPYAYQTILTVNRTYTLDGWARGDGTYIPRVQNGGVTLWTGTTSTSWQQFQIEFVATATDIRFYSNATAAGYCEFDDITVKDTCPDWIAGAGAKLTKETTIPHGGSQCLRVAYTGTVNPRAQQDILTATKTFRVRGWARSDGSRVPRIFSSGAWIWIGTTSTDWQYFDLTTTATATYIRFACYGAAAGYCEFDDITVEEYLGMSNWTPGNSAYLTKETTDPQSGLRNLHIAYNSVNNPFASQAGVFVLNSKYRIHGYARGDGTAYPAIHNPFGVAIWIGTNSTDWQEFDFYHTPTSATGIDLFCNATAAGYCEFDSISINEIPDLLDSDMETSGVADWSVGNAAILTKDTTDPYKGSQCLRVTGSGTGQPYAYQNILTTGEWYKVKGRAKSYSAIAKAKVFLGNNSFFTGSVYNVWETFEFFGQVAAGVDFRLGSNIGSGSEYVDFDDVEISPVLYDPAVAFGCTDLHSIVGRGLTFNGTSDYILGQNTYGAGLTDDFTVCCWIKTSDLWANIISRRDAVNRSWTFRIQNGKLNFEDSGGANWSSSADVNDDQWHYVTAVINGSNSRLYIDGVADTGFTPSITNYTIVAEFGSYGVGTAGFYAGDMVTPEIYGETKTLAWIQNEVARGLETSLKGSYVEQEFTEDVSFGSEITGWCKSGQSGNVIDVPMVAIRTTHGDWFPAWMGIESASGQSISFTWPTSIDAIRLYCKLAEVGESYFDNIDITDPLFQYGQVPNESKEVLRRIVSKYKPMDSWCALLVEYV